MQLQENYIGALLEDGTLRIKEGINGQWRNSEPYGSGKVTQFRVVVDVPVPPARTTPGRFRDSVAVCESIHKKQDICTKSIPPVCNPKCYPTRTPWAIAGLDPPTAYYGLFAGANIPGGGYWDWAVKSGPVDPMDALTMHHDAAYKCPCGSDPEPSVGWYPEGESGLSYLCVVRYGLENAMLTRNGKKIDISQSTRGDWGGLANLYDTIYTGAGSYWTGSAAGCPTIKGALGNVIYSQVEEFTKKTKAKHNN
jgi:hypothetical protein